MEHLADRLDRAADTLATLDRRLPALAVPADALAAAAAGLPGRLGRDLHAHWTAVLDARSQEAAAAAVRLTEMAGSVRTTQRHYTETDEAARARFGNQLPETDDAARGSFRRQLTGSDDVAGNRFPRQFAETDLAALDQPRREA